MSQVFDGSAIHYPSHNGDENTDSFAFTIPSGEGFDRVELSFLEDNRGVFSIDVSEQPSQGDSGDLRVIVHWRYDDHFGWNKTPNPAEGYEYFVKVFSKTLDGEPGRVFLFEHNEYEGRFKMVENSNEDLTSQDGAFFNDRVSSIVIVKGNWCFYKNSNFSQPYMYNGRPVVLDPGMYHDVTKVDIENDDLSSLLCVVDPPNHR